MKRTLPYLLGFVFSLHSLLLNAQEYSSCTNINEQDSSIVNSAVLTPDGSLITASIHRAIYTPSGNGVPGSRIYGNLVIRKQGSSGNASWEFDIPNSIGRFMHLKQAPNGDLIATAAFVDSIEIGSRYKFFAEDFRTNGFVLCLSPSGQLKWARSQDPQAWSIYYNQFDFNDGKIHLPYINFDSTLRRTMIQVLDAKGDQVDNILLSPRDVIISQFEFDTDGNLYMAGTGGGLMNVGGKTLGSDSVTFGISAS